MEIHILQHTPTEPPGIIGEFLDNLGIPHMIIHLYETNELPKSPATHLVVLGGPMNVYDEVEFPFLAEEKAVIRQFIREDKPVLGICLGAQLIASAQGAPVTRSLAETGWYPITTVPDILPILPPAFHAFQLHEDTFAIPPGGILLCTGKQVANQALVYRSAVGFQFHLELTGKLIQEWTRQLPGPEQSCISRDTARYLNRSNRICEKVLSAFLDGWGKIDQ